MSATKPPINALRTIKRYCEKTQCRRCVYCDTYTDYIGCSLQDTPPCDWEIDEEVTE